MCPSGHTCAHFSNSAFDLRASTQPDGPSDNRDRETSFHLRHAAEAAQRGCLLFLETLSLVREEPSLPTRMSRCPTVGTSAVLNANLATSPGSTSSRRANEKGAKHPWSWRKQGRMWGMSSVIVWSSAEFDIFQDKCAVAYYLDDETSPPYLAPSCRPPSVDPGSGCKNARSHIQHVYLTLGRVHRNEYSHSKTIARVFGFPPLSNKRRMSRQATFGATISHRSCCARTCRCTSKAFPAIGFLP